MSGSFFFFAGGALLLLAAVGGTASYVKKKKTTITTLFTDEKNYSFETNEQTQPSAFNSLLSGLFPTSAPSFGFLFNSPITPREAAKDLLEEIGKHESGGDYNIVYGGKKIALTNMTLNEVSAYQNHMVKVKRLPSSAVGKYQFIRKTFDSVRAQMGLSGFSNFTPKIQDEMAYQLLLNRGWESFLNGQKSRDSMMKSISQEWASFPENYKGLSYYAGDGLNKASASPQRVALLLDAAIQETSRG